VRRRGSLDLSEQLDPVRSGEGCLGQDEVRMGDLEKRQDILGAVHGMDVVVEPLQHDAREVQVRAVAVNEAISRFCRSSDRVIASAIEWPLRSSMRRIPVPHALP